MTKQPIILKNEQQVNEIVTKILLWSLITFPLLILLSKTFIGFFPGDYTQYLFPGILGTICHFTPYLLKKLHFKPGVVKYAAIIGCTISVGIIHSNPSFIVSLILLFPVSLSLLYFDKKLTAFAIGLTLFVMMPFTTYIFDVAIYERFGIAGVEQMSLTMEVIWDIIVYTIELAILSGVFMMLTRRTRDLLEGLISFEEKTLILDKLRDAANKSASASDVLVDSVNQLTRNTEETTRVNHIINENAENAIGSSQKNLEYVQTTTKTVEDVSKNLDIIYKQAQEMSLISKETYEAAVESEIQINESIRKMEDIETSTMESKVLMHRFGERAAQISQVVKLIAGIAKQTNLLALNAAIESSRAGEHGRGFSVVAQQIKELSEKSSKAAKEIAILIQQEQNDAKNAVQSFESEAETVKSGIDMVKTAGESFGKLKVVQEESNQKAQEIATFVTQSFEYGKAIVQIITNIRELTLESQKDIQSIVTSSEHQITAMADVNSSVTSLDIIAADLLKLSRSIKELNS
jgi:methyl-accepting chemotaxis protein